MIDTLIKVMDTTPSNIKHSVMTYADTLKAQNIADFANKIIGSVQTGNPIVQYILAGLTLIGSAVSIRCWYVIKKHNQNKAPAN